MANETLNVILANHFKVEIDGMDAGTFEEVAVSESAYEVIQNRTGTDPNYQLPSAGLDQPQTITLRKVARDVDIGIKDFFRLWHQARDTIRKGGLVHYCKRDGSIFHTETWVDGICSSFNCPDGDANANEKAIFEAVISVPRTTG